MFVSVRPLLEVPHRVKIGSETMMVPSSGAVAEKALVQGGIRYHYLPEESPQDYARNHLTVDE